MKNTQYTAEFTKNQTAILRGYDGEKITDVIEIPCAPWADRHAVADMLKAEGRARGLRA